MGTRGGGMPTRGTDGFERAALLASYLDPIGTWIEKGGQAASIMTSGFEILSWLGKSDE